MEESSVIYEVKDQIAFITLNRPEKRNAINTKMAIELGKTWERFESDLEARVAILSGRGSMFSAGADITPGEIDFGAGGISKAWPWNGIKTFKPVICAVHGKAVGAGYGLSVIHADITVAAKGALFMEPESKLGVPGRLFEYMPVMTFKASIEFYLTSEWLPAERAYQLGLVNKVVPEAELMNEAIRYANVLKKNAPLTMRAMKYAHYKAMDNKPYQVQRDTEAFITPQVESEDWKEGRQAFMEKREPDFKGN